MRRRPLRRKTEPSAGEADGSDSEVEDPPGSRSHTGVNPTMMNPGFGNGASHPLGWSGMGPKRAATEGPAEPDLDAAFGWAEMAHGAYKDFLAAAAQVPEAMPRPVPLNHDLRVVLNVPSGSPVAREMCIVSVKEETTAKPVQRPGSAKPKSSETEAPPPEEDYDGACGVIVSASEDAEGCWTVEATRKGVTHILRVPGYGLLWQGAPVLVAIEGEEKEEAGLLAAERPERSTGLWLVEIHKTLALLPGNLRERRLPGFEDEGGAQLPLVRGVSVELCDLRAGAAYNGLSGVVLSSAPNARGRWEVAVKVPVHVARERFILVGVPKEKYLADAKAFASVESTFSPGFSPGDVVELRGLKSAPQHNGKSGTLQQQVSSKSGEMRWRVKCGDIMLDLKEVNLVNLKTQGLQGLQRPQRADDEPSCPPLPGDGSDGRFPPMFRSSLERAAKSDSHLGPRRGGIGGPGFKRRREDAVDPMRLLEENLAAEEEKKKEKDIDAAEEGCGALRMVMRAGAGVDNLALPVLRERGIQVANAQDANATAVAELTFAHLLNLDRRLSDQVESLRRGEWRRLDFAKGPKGLFGRNLAVLGVGNIGREVIRRAVAFGMQVRAWSRSFTPQEARELNVEFCTTPAEAVDGADALCVHLALAQNTRNLVDRSLLWKLKPGALVVNMSRGGVVDEAALLDAVEAHGIRAGLDVYAKEPGANGTEFEDAAIMNCSGVYGSHHTGARTEQAAIAVETAVLRVVSAYLEGRPIPGLL